MRTFEDSSGVDLDGRVQRAGDCVESRVDQFLVDAARLSEIAAINQLELFVHGPKVSVVGPPDQAQIPGVRIELLQTRHRPLHAVLRVPCTGNNLGRHCTLTDGLPFEGGQPIGRCMELQQQRFGAHAVLDDTVKYGIGDNRRQGDHRGEQHDQHAAHPALAFGSDARIQG